MPCAASLPPLSALLDAGCDVGAVLLPAGGGADPAVAERARGAGVPVVWVRDLGSATIATITAHRPDAIVVACFPWRLPTELLALPPLGCLNVHPSLLPVGRGPDPVFWTLRRGERRTGVTIHLMDGGFDTGPIVAQATVEVPDGIRAPALESRLMAIGGQLLVEALPTLAAGTLAAVAQDDALATPAPRPMAADLVVPTNLPARWAFNFVRGVAPLGLAPELLVLATGDRSALRDALDFEAEGGMAVPLLDEGLGVLRVRFRPGVVRFQTTESLPPHRPRPIPSKT